MNLLDVRVSTPVELVRNHFLRRATADEIHQLRQYLGPPGLLYTSIFESRDDRNVFSTSGSCFQTSTDPGNWRYWVVEIAKSHTGPGNPGISQLQAIGYILRKPLPCSIVVSQYGINRYGYASSSLFTSVKSPFIPVLIDQDALDSIKSLKLALDALDPKYANIERATRMFSGLCEIGGDNPLYALGIFAVIESLLTHDSQGVYDSLGRQIRTKMQLLNNRFESPLDTLAFGHISLERLWKKLYAYRSCIAHGSSPDFAKDVSDLKNPDLANGFLTDAAGELLIHALKEPQLITDLQKC